METEKGIDLGTIPQTAIRVLTAPSAFFKEMPKRGGFIEPLIFVVVMGIVSGLIQAVLGIIGLRFVAGMSMALASVILVPIVVAIGSFIGAGILFVIWRLMGSQESYETAYRCGAYVSALTPITTILGIIPYIGSPIGIVLGTFFIVIASIEVHNIPSQKAWLVFGIIGAILVIFSLSSEFAARRLAREAIKFQREWGEKAKEMERDAEEARKAAEELQRQLEKQLPAR